MININKFKLVINLIISKFIKWVDDFVTKIYLFVRLYMIL